MQALGEAIAGRDEAGVGVAQALGPRGHRGGQVVEDGGAPPLVGAISRSPTPGRPSGPRPPWGSAPWRPPCAATAVRVASSVRMGPGVGGLVGGRRATPASPALARSRVCSRAARRCSTASRLESVPGPPLGVAWAHRRGRSRPAGAAGRSGRRPRGWGRRCSSCRRRPGAHHDPVDAPGLPGVEEALVVFHHRLQVAHHVHPQAHRVIPRGGGGRARSGGAGSGAGAGARRPALAGHRQQGRARVPGPAPP